MAGEWIAYDLGLPDKPEVQELIDTTGLPVAEIVFALLRLWGWAALNSSDGRARMTVPRLVRTCGQDQAFWYHVAAVGWLEIDETDATVAIPGWDRRFSQAAKSRIQQSDRAKAYEDRNPGRKRPPDASDARAPERPMVAHRRGDRGDRGEVPPPPREASLESAAADPWPAFRERWNDGHKGGNRREWKPATPPNGWADRIAEAGWLDMAFEAIDRLATCRYFESPVAATQIVLPGFVQRALGGQYDPPKQSKGGERPDDRPTVKGWHGEDQARFEATRQKAMKQLEQEANR
jgi:hypothetical protein